MFDAVKYFLFITIFAAAACDNCIDHSKVNSTGFCTTDYNPVCGCDDVTYRNECYAAKAGLVQWIEGPCP